MTGEDRRRIHRLPWRAHEDRQYAKLADANGHPSQRLYIVVQCNNMHGLWSYVHTAREIECAWTWMVLCFQIMIRDNLYILVNGRTNCFGMFHPQLTWLDLVYDEYFRKVISDSLLKAIGKVRWGTVERYVNVHSPCSRRSRCLGIGLTAINNYYVVVVGVAFSKNSKLKDLRV